ncbi:MULTISPECIES: phage tail assembly protein [unclassified Brucella]|uniref:phage tail assembly protein n=1 Tax=unclassified Brucella TaxID=2632610 RepID=UPI00217E4737|nr:MULTISPECIES: phage tail assembly protein [unclassified Brucella]UWF67375.1 phage tail assembly protein [Brucella sp. 1315]UWF70500.1 phage tail assembly protein [Brucella sp. 2594]
MSEPVKVKLSTTYKLAGVETDEITIREPKVADLITVERVANGGGNNAVLTLMIAQLSGATQPEIAQFSISDYKRCSKIVTPFLIEANADGDA